MVNEKLACDNEKSGDTTGEASKPLNIENNLDGLNDIIDYLTSLPDINFKSQQIGEKELTNDEKETIARNIYSKSAFSFLTKFGTYLTMSHLDFFEKECKDESDIVYSIIQLKQLLIEKNNKVITKNRRYEALSKMLEKDAYFSEVEMMKRNPLLYDQLIGRYLSDDEKKARDNIDTANITLLNVLIEGMDKQTTKDKLNKQMYEEECQMEESDEEDESEEEVPCKLWGEFSENVPKPVARKKNSNVPFITASERKLLREEFFQEMFRSFLAGEDKDFDYEQIDNNVEYDSVEMRTRDEEEKYFDSETPEEVMEQEMASENQQENDGESEDELDVYMRHLSGHPSLKPNIMTVD